MYNLPAKCCFGNILHRRQNVPAYKQHNFHIDFDTFQMTLTFISVANVYIARYGHHPQQAYRSVGMLGF